MRKALCFAMVLIFIVGIYIIVNAETAEEANNNYKPDLNTMVIYINNWEYQGIKFLNAEGKLFVSLNSLKSLMGFDYELRDMGKKLYIKFASSEIEYIYPFEKDGNEIYLSITTLAPMFNFSIDYDPDKNILNINKQITTANVTTPDFQNTGSNNSCATPYCYHMVWGYVLDSEGHGIKNITVTLDEVRTANRQTTQTNDDGLYLFNFYEESSGNVNVGATQGGSKTVTLKTDKSIRQDFDYNTGFGLNLPPEELESHIVYITDYGTKYHKYGCQYLWDSCIPMPYYLVRGNNYEPCSECW